jgi:hypothetical protein
MSGDNLSRKNKRKGQKHIEMDSLLRKHQELAYDLQDPGAWPGCRLCVLSDSRFISSSDLGKRRKVVFGFGPVPMFEALSR